MKRAEKYLKEKTIYGQGDEPDIITLSAAKKYGELLREESNNTKQPTEEENWINPEILPKEHADILIKYCRPKSRHFPNAEYVTQSSYYNDEFETIKEGDEVLGWMSMDVLSQPPTPSKEINLERKMRALLFQVSIWCNEKGEFPSEDICNGWIEQYTLRVNTTGGGIDTPSLNINTNRKEDWISVEDKREIKINSMHWICDDSKDSDCINVCWYINGEWQDSDGDVYQKIHKCKITHYQPITLPSPPKD